MKYVLGLDGGGTKTEAVLIDENGRVIGSGVGGPARSHYAGVEVARQSVWDAILRALEGSLSIRDVACVGECGCSEARVVLQELGYSGQTALLYEYDVAFRRAGLRGNRGVIVIAGTGSNFRACDGGENCAHVGGWGMAVGDEGSGFDIGFRAIKAAGRHMDGRGPRTALHDLLCQETGARHFSHILWTLCNPLRHREIAALARIVTTAAQDGDQVAVSILNDAGRSLGEDAKYVARGVFQPDDEFDVVLAGGVFHAGEFVVGPLREAVQQEFPNATIHLPVISAGEAVARLTLEKLQS